MAANATSWSRSASAAVTAASSIFGKGDHCVRRTILSLRLNLDVPVLGFVHDQLCGLCGDLAHLGEQGA